MQTWTNSQPAAARAGSAGAVAGDAMADALETAELLDVDMDQLAGMSRARSGGPARRARVAASGSVRGACRMRLTVAGETPISAAICLPVQRWRRSATIRSTIVSAASACAADAAARSGPPGRPALRPRSARPTCAPSWRQTPTAVATAFGVCPLPAPAAPSPLDYAASDGHSCGRSSGPPRNPEASQLQLPRSGPDGQPIESSHLARKPRHRAARKRTSRNSRYHKIPCI